MPRRIRRALLVLLAIAGLLLLLFVAYKTKRRWDGQALAKTLRGPTLLLCPAWHEAEGGGCFGDCQMRLRVREAKGAMAGAKAFAALATYPDPEVEARLSVIRATSAVIPPALAADCSFDMERFAKVTPEIQRCAATVKATPWIHKLVHEVSDVVAFGEDRSGAHFVNMHECEFGTTD